MKKFVITIDGPSGSGKSTAARNLARRLGYLYLDTGAMYRAVALKALRSGIPLSDRKGLAALAARCRIRFQKGAGGSVRVFLDGSDVTRAVRRPEVAAAASQAATIPALRRSLVRQQRRMGQRGGIVAEGRDTGTVVFPRAELKFFLKASFLERARRRWQELQGAGRRISLGKVLQEMKARDRRDRHRAASPLRVPSGAVRIDNSRLQSTGTLDKMLDYVRRIRK